MRSPIKVCTLLFLLSFSYSSVQSQNIIYTVAGSGYNAGSGFGSFCCDGQPPLFAGLNLPTSVAFDKTGNMYIADFQNNRVREVNKSTGNIYTIAGGGTSFLTDSVLATKAQLGKPSAVFVDDSNNIYIVQNENCTVSKIQASTGLLFTIAGSGSLGYSGDGFAAKAAKLKYPFAIFVDKHYNVFIADQGNHVIRKVDATTGIISTVAGSGTPGFGGDSALATSAKLSSPAGVWVDSLNNIYISDHGNNRVRKVDGATKIITTIAGNGGTAFFGDGGPAVNAKMNGPAGLWLDKKRWVLYIADQSNNAVRALNLNTNLINTIAGNSSSGYTGDSSDARLAQLRIPTGLAMDVNDNLFIADQNNNVIRKVAVDYSEVPPVCLSANYIVYPNPSTTGKFRIVFPDNDNHDVLICNAIGKVVFESVVSGLSDINLNGQPTGIYFVKIKSGENFLVQKMIIRH